MRLLYIVLAAGMELEYLLSRRLLVVFYIRCCRPGGSSLNVHSSLLSLSPMSSYYNGLYHHRNSDDIRRLITLTVSERVVHVAVKFLLMPTIVMRRAACPILPF